MSGPYVNEDGDIWVEVGPGVWPKKAWSEARSVTDEPIRYAEKSWDIRVSDELEYAHGDDDACRDANGGDHVCCRTTDAYHFRVVDETHRR